MGITSRPARQQWLLSAALCSAYCVALFLWTQTVLLKPLRVKAIEMAHMDPSEIIAVPLPLSTVATFVGFPALVLFLVSVPWWDIAVCTRQVSRFAMTTVITLAISILCGAHPIHNIEHTLLASMYVSALLVWHPQHASESEHAYFYTMLAVAIPIQILHILDTGLQIQRWPIPFLLGSTAGSILGTVVDWLLYTILSKKHTS